MKKGDKITVVSANGNAIRATVENEFGGYGPDGAGRAGFRWYTSWGYSELAYCEDEGTRWIPGYHEADADEVKALLAAAAMSPSTWRIRASGRAPSRHYPTSYGGSGD